MRHRPDASRRFVQSASGLALLEFDQKENDMSEAVLLDRSLTIQVTATSNWIGPGPNDLGANISYQEFASDPNFPNAIDHDGNIYLSRMRPSFKYTDNLDITFLLVAQMTQRDGKTALPARWAQPGEGSGTWPGVAEGFCWFCASSTDWRPIPGPAGMSLIRNSDTSLTIDDNTPDKVPSYRFCLGLMVPTLNNHFITIEPIIVGKGDTKPPTSSPASEKC
jgi:hypothetical protein